jgi:hypothetical protein
MSEHKRWLAGAVGLALGMVLTVESSLRGQVPAPPPLDANKTLFPVQEMRDGKRRVVDSDKQTTKQNREALQRAAQHFAYSLAQPPYNGDPPVAKKGGPSLEEMIDRMTIPRLMDDAQRLFNPPMGPTKKLSDAQLEYIREFASAIDKELHVVLEKGSKPIVRINAARMLSLAARSMPYPGFADGLMSIIKDPKEHEEVKLYAFQGLNNLLAQPGPDANQPHIFEDTAKVGEIADTLAEYILKPREPESKDPKTTEVVRFIRREAIRAFCQLRVSVVKDRANVVKAKTKPAVLAMRIALGDDVFVPSLSLSERIEGLIGFMNMHPDVDENPDVAAYGIILAMLELVRAQGDADKTIPWKVTGARLSAAADNLKINTTEALAPRLRDRYMKVAEVVTPIAKALEESGDKAKPDAIPINEWAQQQVPMTNQLFKDDAQSALKGPAGKK